MSILFVLLFMIFCSCFLFLYFHLVGLIYSILFDCYFLLSLLSSCSKGEKKQVSTKLRKCITAVIQCTSVYHLIIRARLECWTPEILIGHPVCDFNISIFTSKNCTAENYDHTEFIVEQSFQCWPLSYTGNGSSCHTSYLCQIGKVIFSSVLSTHCVQAAILDGVSLTILWFVYQFVLIF